jgi:predicted acylesterase/phospholipase RssA
MSAETRVVEILRRITEAAYRRFSELPPMLHPVLFVLGMMILTITFVVVGRLREEAIGRAVGIAVRAAVGPVLLLALIIGCAVAMWRGYRTAMNVTRYAITAALGLLLTLSVAVQFGVLLGVACLVLTAALTLTSGKMIAFLKSESSMLAAALTVTVLKVIGTHSLVRDIVCVILAVLIIWWLPRFIPALARFEDTPYAAVAAAVALWSFVSLGDAVGGASGIRRPSLRNKIDTPVRVAAALSGGGYRAAVFHAGVLTELKNQGIYVDALATVSGGSIIGSFYATGGDPAQFLSAVKSHEFNLKRELFSIIHLPRVVLSARIPFTAIRLLPMNPVTTTTVQASLLDRLYLGGQYFNSLHTQPALMVCATDLVNGSAVGITAAGTVVSPVLEMGRRLRPSDTEGAGVSFTATLPGDERLSSFVAASGAFPAALPPYAISGKPMTPEEAAEESSAERLLDALTGTRRVFPQALLVGRAVKPLMLLADGGLADNIGTGLLKHAIALADNEPGLRAFKADVIIASDASALVTRGDAPGSAVGEVARAIDTIYLATGESSLPRPSRDIEPIVLSAKSLVDFRRSYLTIRYDVVKDPVALNAVLAAMPDELRRAIQQKTASTSTKGALRYDGREILEREVADELDSCLRYFAAFSTLDDRPDADKAEAVYRLGRYVVALNREHIREAMRRAAGVGSPRDVVLSDQAIRPLGQ